MAESQENRGASGARPEAAGLASRRGALEVIERVRGGESLDDALDRSRAFSALEGPDRGFARALIGETLRRRGSLDHILGAYIDRPLPKRAARIMDILRLAAAQLLLLQTPDHAAVATAVDLAQERRETENYAKLVNAITRKVAKAGPAALEKLPERIDAPGWMWRGWERGFGPVKARAIAEAHRRQPGLDLTLRDPRDAPGRAERLGAELLLGASLRLVNPPADIKGLDGFAEGAWWVQDAAAALPARLLCDVGGKRVFDLCAAPGGKTMQLAAAGARVAAVDISPPRLEILKENLARTGLAAELIEADILNWSPNEKADAVLLDAPCTATGTLRRHPDLAWLKTEDDLAALSKLQARMIDHAKTFVKPGGVLLYCVCSLQPEEGERQAQAALKRNADLSRLPITAEEAARLPEGAVTRDGDLRTLPSMLADKGGMDGFFAARFVVG
ncbi:MAG: RsmB/NOP family class I SAM-dependent RNA methyltransferase [Pseudomonadota bacterium]